MALKDWFSALKLSRPTQDNNEFMAALFNLTRFGQVKFYDQDPETYIKEGYVTNPHVYSVINKIIQPLSGVKFNVYEVVDDEVLVKANTLRGSGDYLKHRVLSSKALQKLDNDPFELQKFFKRPNECQSWAEFISENVGFKLLLGNSFTYGLEPEFMTREQNKIFTKIYNLPAQFVEIITGDWTQPIAYYKLLVNHQIKFEADKVLHRKYWNPQYSADGAYSFHSLFSSGMGGNNYYGMSPLSPLCRVVKRSNDSFLASMRMLENGIPAGILSSKGKSLTSDEAKKLRDSYKAKFGGAKNKNEILFATSEMAWQSLGMNSVDMQLLDSNKADLQDIARVYRVPLPLLMNDASTMDNMKASEKSLWHNAIIPELDEIRQSFNMFLVPGWEELTGKKLYIDYDISNVNALQQNMKEQSDRLIQEMERGLWTIGEVREALGGDITDEDIMTKRLLSNGLSFINDNNSQQDEDGI